MKKIILLFITFSCLVVNTEAQTNRRNTKKSVAYRANYQRMASGCMSGSSFQLIDGFLYAHGLNDHSQLGNGGTTDKLNPIIIGSSNDWISVVSSADHTLGLKADGTLLAWGDNTNGKLGDGTTIDKPNRVPIGSVSDFWISVATSNYYSLGLKADGTLWSWGNNSFGQLGNGTLVKELSPIKVGTDKKWVSIAAMGDYTSIALKADGTLWTWGDNSTGQLGDATPNYRTTPGQIGNDTKWVSIAAGQNHCLALKSDGTLWAWGYNEFGQVGDNTQIDKNAPTQIGTDNKWVSISAGANHSMGLKSDGTLWTWGNNRSWQLGNNDDEDVYVPTQIGTDNKWVSIAGGRTHSLASKCDGTLWGWGMNGEGQLGDGTMNPQFTPKQIATNNTMTISVSSGIAHSVGLRSDGTLWVWGWNGFGQLANNTSTQELAPIQVGTEQTWISASAGLYHNLAIKADGTLWAWGYNNGGQLGDNSKTIKYTPVQIGSDHNWVSISGGHSHSVALKSDGTLWTWGYNFSGQLGDGSTTEHLVPQQVGTDTKWVSISASMMDYNCVGLKSDGTVWTWGGNSDGQLGIGAVPGNQLSPVQVGTAVNWVTISFGRRYCLGLQADGSLWAWGDNPEGQLGNNNDPIDEDDPIKIGNGDMWTAISTSSHSLGLKANGKLFAWGLNYDGALGDGTDNDKDEPLAIGTGTKWVGISAGGGFTVAFKSTRDQFCSAGSNGFGQLGDGSTTESHTLSCVNNSGNTLRIGEDLSTVETTITAPLVIYPNPNNGTFAIQSSQEGTYMIINDYGKTIQLIQLTKENQNSISIEHLTPGLYFVVGMSDGKKVTQKVVIQQ